MGNGMNKILPGLYIGNFRDSKDKEQLTKNSITHIVSAHDNARALLQGFLYHCINVEDSVGQDLRPYFEDCVMFIHRARIEGGNVLVHCLAGISRSTTLVIAYIMSVTDMDWMEVLKAVKCCRSVVNPNSAFKRQLYEFGKSQEIEKLKRKLKQQYRSNPFEDEQFLKQVMANTSESQPKLFQEYEDGVNELVKYSYARDTNTNRSARVVSSSPQEHDNDHSGEVK